MESVTLIFKTLLLDKASIQQLSLPKSNWKWHSFIITILLGLFYGFTAININKEIITSFETPMLRDLVIPGLFLFFGYLMMLITKVGLTLLLWAGSKGLGGGGYLGLLYRNTTIALIPSVIALPAFISLQVGTSPSTLMIVSIIIAILWIYLVSVKIVETVQQFAQWKAYIAVLLAFIFFMSIYYMILPPPA
ncbi:hypothetical protein RJD24_04085 [Bacillaceae bacterium IKA-2]|jgi:hypothetical protein|nr:hypothetical protein RJD24_04085 [Bacillaceae bacterium IKA-2]